MTGRELIKLIKKNHAEDMTVLVQYRDSGGTYRGGEWAEFHLAHGKMLGEPYGYEYDIQYGEVEGQKPNVIVL